MDELRSPAERANNRSISRDLTSQEKGLLASLNLGTRPDRAQVRQNPQASQKYRDGVQKRAKSEFAGGVQGKGYEATRRASKTSQRSARAQAPNAGRCTLHRFQGAAMGLTVTFATYKA